MEVIGTSTRAVGMTEVREVFQQSCALRLVPRCARCDRGAPDVEVEMRAPRRRRGRTAATRPTWLLGGIRRASPSAPLLLSGALVLLWLLWHRAGTAAPCGSSGTYAELVRGTRGTGGTAHTKARRSDQQTLDDDELDLRTSRVRPRLVYSAL